MKKHLALVGPRLLQWVEQAVNCTGVVLLSKGEEVDSLGHECRDSERLNVLLGGSC